ncbi:phospholipase D-like domain-containing protein [Arenimonas fontis]|uniref:Phospholipase D family protein n=1 Tax=Arenimonas fontis TaxID=2608255 RepID=A0A5B2ZCB7_9GAMM|nr:phospholipase D family protein [Arenimonas fontis]KAA2284772.1 phospholipase D family protein [Arenimonas fontis]
MTPRLLLALCALLALAGCTTLEPRIARQAAEIAEAGRLAAPDCVAEACAPARSPLLELAQAAVAESTPEAPRHQVTLLDYGQDALLARVHLIRAARERVELQSFIFDSDDAGLLVLEELLAAARRGVKVRVLLDQLYGLPDPGLQAALAGAHRNFELRLYNPTFNEAQTQKLQFAAGILCCFRSFNRRMHTKLLLVDGVVGITGGRNIQDRYFDWGESYNYRDRDILVAGPVAREMGENFEAFWRHPLSVPAEGLRDVAERLVERGEVLRHRHLDPARVRSPRVQAMAEVAGDGQRVWERLSPFTLPVGPVEFYADLPDKHAGDPAPGDDASLAMRELVAGVREELVLQTPYLVFSRPAKKLFKTLQKREDPPVVWVSTNSLAATDAFPVYAMSHKYKRFYLRELRFRIFEYKPYPEDAPIQVAATGALGPEHTLLPIFGSGSAGSASGPVPLKRAGVRVGLHSKSLVVDNEVGVVGSHNFDPRSDHLNTESMVVVHDPQFAAALHASIRRDMSPANAWLIAAHRKSPILPGLVYSLGKISEKLPIFDIWPFPYATSYELKPGCNPMPPGDPRFHDCHEDVGAFPEVDIPLKTIYTRILTAFGAGLVPIL